MKSKLNLIICSTRRSLARRNLLLVATRCLKLILILSCPSIQSHTLGPSKALAITLSSHKLDQTQSDPAEANAPALSELQVGINNSNYLPKSGDSGPRGQYHRPERGQCHRPENGAAAAFPQVNAAKVNAAQLDSTIYNSSSIHNSGANHSLGDHLAPPNGEALTLREIPTLRKILTLGENYTAEAFERVYDTLWRQDTRAEIANSTSYGRSPDEYMSSRTGIQSERPRPATSQQDVASNRAQLSEIIEFNIPVVVADHSSQSAQLRGWGISRGGQLLSWPLLKQGALPTVHAQIGGGTEEILLAKTLYSQAADGQLAPKLVALTRRGGDVQVWNATDGELHSINQVGGLPTRVVSIDLQPDGQAVLMGGADGKIYRWLFLSPPKSTLLKRGKPIERYLGASSVSGALAFHPTGRIFVSGGWDGRITVWQRHDKDKFEGEYDKDYLRGRFFTDFATRASGGKDGDSPVKFLQFSQDGQYLLVVYESGTIDWWQVRGFKSIASISGHAGLVYGAAVSADGKQVATVGRDGMLKVFEMPLESGRVLSGETEYVPTIREYFRGSSSGARFVQFNSGSEAALLDSERKINLVEIVKNVTEHGEPELTE